MRREDSHTTCPITCWPGLSGQLRGTAAANRLPCFIFRILRRPRNRRGWTFNGAADIAAPALDAVVLQDVRDLTDLKVEKTLTFFVNGARYPALATKQLADLCGARGLQNQEMKAGHSVSAPQAHRSWRARRTSVGMRMPWFLSGLFGGWLHPCPAKQTQSVGYHQQLAPCPRRRHPHGGRANDRHHQEDALMPSARVMFCQRMAWCAWIDALFGRCAAGHRS